MKLKLYEARYQSPAESSEGYIEGRRLVASNFPKARVWTEIMQEDTTARDLTLRQVGSVEIDRRKVSPRFNSVPGERIELYLASFRESAPFL